jgi:hypothetical protein
LAYLPQDYPLNTLLSEWYFNQMTWKYLTFQLRGQMIMKNALHLRDIDCDF